ncbi:taste receptor type 2 member 143-like [Elephas maximus indicus]|uniref:taste receptor type 2 member 143-like n=1 Tax=Elephas maximus indicus TaxID=99487 RepID=UPI0021163CEF|nr:taste receptor type 2 member 143-like [Elephas maximus indicus]
MPTSPTLFFMAIFFLGSLAAMLQNGLMAAVLGWEWARGHALPAGDMIVACLATSWLGLHGMSIVNSLLPTLSIRDNVHYIRILWDFNNMLNFWLNALLSVFYCVKITFFSHPAFLWFRWRLSRSVPTLLLGSLAISVLTTIPSVIGHIIAIQMAASKTPHTNGSWVDQAITFRQKFFLLHETLVPLLPFLLFLVSTALLIFSLWQHLRQMQGSHPGPRDPSTQAHTVALKLLSFFLVFYTSYFLSLIVTVMNLMPLHLHWYWVWQVAIYTSISLHSTFLLLSSPRLRRARKNGLLDGWAIGCRGLDIG